MIEAAEQTVLQRSIPFERQGRVFGFAQLVENAAAPVTAFMIGPFAETFVMPFMTDGRGADAIGDWFGTGPDRGLALMFTVAGLIGIVVTLLVWGSRSYRQLSQGWEAARVEDPGPHPSGAAIGLGSHVWTHDQAEAFAGLCRAAGFVRSRRARPTRRARLGCRWR